MNKKLIVVGTLLCASILFYIAPDHPTHLHNGWVFNKMLKTGQFHIFDPYTGGGHQFLWSYGVPANFIVAVLWFAFSEFSLNIAEAAIFAVFLFYSTKIIKDEKKLVVWWLLTYFILPFTGAYVYLLSFTLFFIGFTKKGKLKSALQLLAGINHVYFSMINLLFVSRKRKNFFNAQIIILAIQLSMILILRLGGGYAGLMIFGIFWFRLLAVAYPYVFTEWIKLKPSLIKVRRPGKLNKAYKIGATTGIAICMIVFPMMSNTEFTEYNFDKLPIHPDSNGTARLVDINIIGVYQLPKQGLVLSTSQYFHEQENLIFNKTKYLDMLKKYNISYVIYCANCIISNMSQEKKFLEEEFKAIYSDNEYMVFDTRNRKS